MTETPTTQTPAPAATPADNKPDAPADAVKLATELGETKAKLKELETYREQTVPLLETVWNDAPLLKDLTEKHNKRLGKVTDTPADKTPAAGDKPEIPAAPFDQDTRTALINQASSTFEEKHGISKLSEDEQKQMRGKVGAMLKEMVDPRGNKSMAQVFEDISLTKLPWYLDRAYDLVTKDEQLKHAMEAGKNSVLDEYDEARGTMGNIPGTSVPIEQMTLSPAQKKVAAKQGISEADYLSQLKKIAAER